MRKLILYISMSLDGFIAGADDDLSFLDQVVQEGEDYGHQKFMEGVDTVIMGRKTFDWVFRQIADVPYPEKETYVITRTSRTAIGQTQFYTADFLALIKKLKAENGNAIFCDGGAEIVNQLLSEKLFDTLIISIIPVILGQGTRLFQATDIHQELKLQQAQSFDSGLVQLTYNWNR